MEEFLVLANKLAGASLATLLFLILVGSRLRIWRWNQDFLEQEDRHVREMEQEKEDRIEERNRLEQERDWWREQALKGMHIAETQATVLRVKETKERRRMDQ